MSDEIFSAVYARPKRRQGITGQTIDAQMRGTICQITELELEELRDELARLRAEVERLTAALSDERAHADAMAELVADQTETESEFWTEWDEQAAQAMQQHRARRQG